MGFDGPGAQKRSCDGRLEATLQQQFPAGAPNSWKNTGLVLLLGGYLPGESVTSQLDVEHTLVIHGGKRTITQTNMNVHYQFGLVLQFPSSFCEACKPVRF